MMRATPPEFTLPDPAPLAGRLALRLGDLPQALGLSRRAIERLRSAGKFPPPDRTVGRVPIWAVGTVRAWVEGGGR
jgi:predicted DNA-binding transcriptional regulator AlpA